MANAWYKLGAQAVLNGSINMVSDTLKAALVKNTYPQNLTTDQFFTSISAYVLSTPQTLGSKSVALGVFDAGDITYPTVTAGDTSEGIVIYKDTGVAGTSPLLLYIDTITGFPLLTNGGDVPVVWDNGTYKIVSIAG
jgi:hypothetical protein